MPTAKKFAVGSSSSEAHRLSAFHNTRQTRAPAEQRLGHRARQQQHT
jgi:hypothetical protein